MKTSIKHQFYIGLFLSVWSFGEAQERHRFEGQTLSGYEYNYFKSPDQLVLGDSTLTSADLIASSSYQDFIADYDYRYKKKGHRIRFRIAPELRFFHERADDSYWQVNSWLKYDYRLGKRTKLLAEGRFNRMNREGLDGAQDILVNPLGYTLYGASAGLGFALLKNNRSELEFFGNYKNFDAFGSRDLEYLERGASLSTRQEFRPGKYEHQLSARVYYKQRLYTTFNAADSPAGGERDWWYFRSDISYSFPLSGYVDLEPEVIYYQRIDRLEERSGFRQLGAGMRLSVKTEKTKLRAAAKYQLRGYDEIEAADLEGEGYAPLRYDYLDLSLSFEHQLPLKGLFFIGEGFSRVRETNTLSLSSRSFRDYRTYYAGLGLRWKP